MTPPTVDYDNPNFTYLFFFSIYYLLYFPVCVSAYMYAPICVSTHRGQQEATDALELEVKTEPCEVDAGNWTQVLCKSAMSS